MRCFRSRRRSQIASAVRCDPFRINNLACDNIRGCRFAQPPATFYNPYRGNEAMMRENEVIDLLRNAWGRVIDRGTIDWIVSNRSIETNNALPDERFAIVGRNPAWILKGSQMVAGGLPARAHPRSRSHAMFSIPEEIADCACCPM
jgi:hypothetical protein